MGVVNVRAGGSDRARALAAHVRQAAARLADLVATIGESPWHRVPAPGVWSIGREAEHVAEAADYHAWIVRLTIGDRVSSRRPVLERAQMTSTLAAGPAAALIRERAEASARLILSLTDAQLDLPTKPARSKGVILGDTIERVLIGHYDTHRAAIEAKLAGRGA